MMKALILAGGYATRLWPLTKNKPKSLLPVGNKPLIDHIIEKLNPLNLEIIVSTNKRFEKDFRQWSVGREIELIIEDTTSQEEKLGAVKALSEIMVDLEEDLLLVAGDNLFSFDLSPMVDFYNVKKKIVTAIFDVVDPDLVKRYGEADLGPDKRITRFIEKPEKPKATTVGVGIYIFPKNSFHNVFDYVEKNNMADNLGALISWLAEKTDVYGYVFEGSWYDIGNPDTYLEANRFFIEHNISKNASIDRIAKVIPPCVIEDGVEILGRSLIGPYAYIGKGCLIESSDVSDSIIFNSTVIRDSTIWRSMIDENCEIRHLELRKSIVGGHAKIQRGE